MIEAILYPIAGAACVGAGWCARSLVDFGKIDDLKTDRDELAFELRSAASLLLCMGQRIAARKAFSVLGLGPDGAELPKSPGPVGELRARAMEESSQHLTGGAA
jgi:hypothetical protein